MPLADYSVLTFDCYGTLIDWETGIFDALRPLVERSDIPVDREKVLETFARHESAQEAETPTMKYSDLLTVVHRRIAAEWGTKTTFDEDQRFGLSVPDWPAFSDTPDALKYLSQHYMLVILSNVDRRSFAASNERLGIQFDAIYTAEDIGSYKPSLKNFEYMIDKLAERGITKNQILHTAQSLFHDHLPANRVGLASAWIDRRHNKNGYGATSVPEQLPNFDFRFAAMSEMADAHRAEHKLRPRNKTTSA